MGELAGVARAAQREKRAMPPGSQLMLANTSEVVLTREQARNFGLRPVPKANAQDGNAAAELGTLNALIGTLNNSISTLNTRLATGTTQTIQLQVDTNRTIDVRGVNAFDSIVRATLQDRLGEMAPSEELDAVASALGQLVQTLNEQGLVTAGGT